MIHFKEVVPFVFHECVEGKHEECPAHIKPDGNKLGSHCTCGCHVMISREIPELVPKEKVSQAGSKTWRIQEDK